MLSSDRFVSCWESLHEDGSKNRLFARIFNTDGSVIKEEFRVDTDNTVSKNWPSICAFPSGEFFVVW